MSKKPNSKLQRLLAIGLIVLGVSFANDIVATVVTYPTDQHKQTAQQLSEFNNKMMSGTQLSETETSRFDKLNQTPEAGYMMGAAAIAALVSFVIFIYLVFFAYNRIRKQRLADNARGVTVLLVVIASMLTMALHGAFEYLYAGVNSYNTSLGFQVLGMVTGFVAATIITILVTMVAESRYNKKHSFIVE